MTDYKIFRTAAIAAVTEVRLYDETLAHAAEHIESPYFATQDPRIAAEIIAKAINDPFRVEASYKANSFVYVDNTTMNEGEYPLRVPVKIIDGTSGLVKTWYFGTSSASPRILYRKSDDV